MDISKRLTESELNSYLRQVRDNCKILAEDLRPTVLERVHKLNASMEFFDQRVMDYIEDEAVGENPLRSLPIDGLPRLRQQWQDNLDSFREAYRMLVEAGDQLVAVVSVVHNYMAMQDEIRHALETLPSLYDES